MAFESRLVLCLSIVISGCGVFTKPPPTQSEIDGLTRMVYPRDASYSENLDITVRWQGDTLTLVNLTPRRYERMHMWLNQQYVSKVEEIRIGVDNRLELQRFINRHGESFPLAAFLQPDKSFPVVLAELFDPASGQRYRLFVDRTP